MSHLRFLTLATLLTFGAASTSDAALIVSFNFNDLDANADFVHAQVAGTPVFAAGSGLIAPAYVLSASAAGWISTSAGDAIANNQFWEFTVTADPGYLFNLQNITFANAAVPGGPTDFQLEVNNVLFGASQATGGTANIDLSSLGTLSSFQFRIAGYGGASSWFIDDVQLNAAVVPEPSSMLLAGSLIPGFFIARRRLRRQAKQLPSAIAS